MTKDCDLCQADWLLPIETYILDVQTGGNAFDNDYWIREISLCSYHIGIAKTFLKITKLDSVAELRKEKVVET